MTIKALEEAYRIIDSLIQNKSLRYHEQITGWKYDLAMDGYALHLEHPALGLKGAIQKIYRNKTNKLRDRSNKRHYTVILPFSAVPQGAIEAGESTPVNTSNLEMYDQWFKDFEKYAHLLTPGEADLICMLFDGLTIKEICATIGITPPTIYRAIETIKGKVNEQTEKEM